MRKVAERVLRDITIIIFRRFSTSTSLNEMRVQHFYNHRMTGQQLKRQREMSINLTHSTSTDNISNSTPSTSSQPQEQSGEMTSSPTSSNHVLGWDAAALHIITFLSSRINPNVIKVINYVIIHNDHYIL